MSSVSMQSNFPAWNKSAHHVEGKSNLNHQQPWLWHCLYQHQPQANDDPCKSVITEKVVWTGAGWECTSLYCSSKKKKLKKKFLCSTFLWLFPNGLVDFCFACSNFLWGQFLYVFCWWTNENEKKQGDSGSKPFKLPPALMRIGMILSWPPWAAQCRGVEPSWSAWFGLAPCCSRSITFASSPYTTYLFCWVHPVQSTICTWAITCIEARISASWTGESNGARGTEGIACCWFSGIMLSSWWTPRRAEISFSAAASRFLDTEKAYDKKIIKPCNLTMVFNTEDQRLYYSAPQFVARTVVFRCPASWTVQLQIISFHRKTHTETLMNRH